MERCFLAAGALALGLAASPLAAKPIAFANGSTLMAEYGAATMIEVQAFHAPRHWWSAGGGRIDLSSADDSFDRRITYVRGNLLARRWNLPRAQANVFVWGGLGRATGSDFEGSRLARHVGVQLDYETRRAYGSLRSDLHASSAFSHRIDTLQLGWAPYAHDYEDLAAWIVVQGRQYTGRLSPGVEKALLLRLFKGGTWIEFGATTERKLQVMAMFNF